MKEDWLDALTPHTASCAQCQCRVQRIHPVVCQLTRLGCQKGALLWSLWIHGVTTAKTSETTQGRLLLGIHPDPSIAVPASELTNPSSSGDRWRRPDDGWPNKGGLRPPKPRPTSVYAFAVTEGDRGSTHGGDALALRVTVKKPGYG